MTQVQTNPADEVPPTTGKNAAKAAAAKPAPKRTRRRAAARKSAARKERAADKPAKAAPEPVRPILSEIEVQNSSKLSLIKISRSKDLPNPLPLAVNSVVRSFVLGEFAIANDAILGALNGTKGYTVDPDTHERIPYLRVAYNNYGPVPEDLRPLILAKKKKDRIDANEVAKRMGAWDGPAEENENGDDDE